MSTTYLVKEGCGTHIVYDQGELDRHLKMGWKPRPADWKTAKQEEGAARRLEAIKAEQSRLAAEADALAKLEKPQRKVGADTNGDGVIDKEFAPKKRGPKPKAKE